MQPIKDHTGRHVLLQVTDPRRTLFRDRYATDAAAGDILARLYTAKTPALRRLLHGRLAASTLIGLDEGRQWSVSDLGRSSPQNTFADRAVQSDQSSLPFIFVSSSADRAIVHSGLCHSPCIGPSVPGSSDPLVVERGIEQLIIED